jgi:uncharacterized protein (UPF0332 family)
LNTEIESFLAKAQESLQSAEADFAAHRYNSSANRCYYAAFQAAIAALIRAGFRPSTRGNQWSHTFVHSSFAGQLIHRQKRYPASLRETLALLLDIRQVADYRSVTVSNREAAKVLRLARAFLAEVDPKGGEKI